jgi:hypothetical protein
MMNEHGKSDRPVVPAKSPNKAGQPAAEGMEGSGRTKGNPQPQNAPRTPSRTDAPSALERVRQAASKDKETRFTALLHHIYNLETLRMAYFSLKKDAAPGVDGETWRHYGETLEDNLQDLSHRLKRGAYRAKPVRRAYIDKSDGRKVVMGNHDSYSDSSSDPEEGNRPRCLDARIQGKLQQDALEPMLSGDPVFKPPYCSKSVVIMSVAERLMAPVLKTGMPETKGRLVFPTESGGINGHWLRDLQHWRCEPESTVATARTSVSVGRRTVGSTQFVRSGECTVSGRRSHRNTASTPRTVADSKRFNASLGPTRSMSGSATSPTKKTFPL